MASRCAQSDSLASSGTGAAPAAVLAVAGTVLGAVAVRYAEGDVRRLVVGLGSVLAIITGSLIIHSCLRSFRRVAPSADHPECSARPSAGCGEGAFPKPLDNGLTKVLGSLPTVDASHAVPNSIVKRTSKG